MLNLARRSSVECCCVSPMRAALLFGLLLIVLAVSPVSLYSQAVSTGTITGQVTDPTGAAVTDATVTLIDNATSLSRTTTTNDAGGFSFPLLPVSVYTVKVDEKGFRSATGRLRYW